MGFLPEASGLDIGTLLFWLVAAVVAMLSGSVTDLRRYTWRQELPLWMFLARDDVGRGELVARLGEAGVDAAELSCFSCLSRERCRRLARSGAQGPAGHCPNAILFSARAP